MAKKKTKIRTHVIREFTYTVTIPAAAISKLLDIDKRYVVTNVDGGYEDEVARLMFVDQTTIKEGPITIQVGENLTKEVSHARMKELLDLPEEAELTYFSWRGDELAVEATLHRVSIE